MEFEKEVSGSIADEIRKDREELLRKLAIDDEALAELEPAGGPDLWLEYGAMLGERRAAGSRFSTGLRVFDGKLEGGLYPGVVVAIQGPPAAGKTGLASQIALSLGRAGCAVGALYADEGLSGAAVMLGQQFGAARVPLMAGDEGQAQLAIQGAGALPFFRAMRPSHHSATLEKFAEDFDAIAPAGMQRVWLLDSAQTLRLSSKNGGGKESQFDRIARAVEMVRDLTLSMGAITLLVSRVNRAAYAKKKEEEKADPLGSSWGVALEYFVELLVNLEGKPTLEKPRVALRVSKNRVSASGNFVLPLDMDFPRHGFKEVDPTVEEAEKDAAKLTVLALTKGKIIATLTGRDGVSGRALDKEVGGPAAVVREARRELAVEGKIHERDREGKKGGGKEWFLGSTGGGSGRRPGGVSVPLFGDERETE
jgi:KaiC/GvpD/RAD55 family RecA-like ATPase